jgi:hypothetical protein
MSRLAPLLLLAAAANGSASAADDESPVKRALAVRVPAGSIQVDGRLAEPVWETAPAIRDFVQREPQEGAAPTDPMEVRFVYDDAALYVGVRLTARPGSVQAPLSRRDEGQPAENVLVSIDSFHDRRTAYVFGVTAAGVRIDRYHGQDSPDADSTWDPVWDARTSVDEGGWCAEMRIPFSQLRFNPRGDSAWGLNVQRWRPALNEEEFWALIPKDQAGWASHFGELAGLDDLRPPGRTELLPYTAVSSTIEGAPASASPFARRGEPTARVGGDVKTGLGPNLTLEGTMNPDFGQVEADPAEVNLTAFETFFTEKRPFFVEGASLFQSPGQTYYYSRRIGAPPRGTASGDFVDSPRATTILGAGKLTGRLPGGLSLGALAAVTGTAEARTFDAATDTTSRTRVAPGAMYGVARVQQELGTEGSTIGAILTGVQRDFKQAEPVAAIHTRSALAGGTSALIRLDGGTYELGGDAGFSHVDGEPAAIERLQRASARYYQRPDQGYVRVDPTRRSLDGWTASLTATKKGGRHWLWDLGASAQSPGFEINDLGILGFADDRRGWGTLRYRETKPGRLFHAWEVSLAGSASTDFGGLVQQTETNTQLQASLTWKNYLRTSASLSFIPASYDSRYTRGGVAAGRANSTSGSFMLASNAAARNLWDTSAGFFFDEDGASTVNGGFSISLRPSSRWRLALTPYAIRGTYSMQYVATLGGGPPETFGLHNIYALTARTTLSLPVRASYVFSPDLSIDVYAELFAASGRYHDWGQIPAPRTRLERFADAGDTLTRNDDGSVRVDEPGGGSFVLPNLDFDLRSFRSNVVLRWEWRPGSTVYLVWQQDRLGPDPTGTAATGFGDLLRSPSAPGNHYFALKASFYLPMR